MDPYSYSYQPENNKSYPTTVTTTTYASSHGETTPTDAVIPYGSHAVTPYDLHNSGSPTSVSSMQSEAMATKARRRRRRRVRMAAAGVTGAVVGGIALGPLGAAAGGVGAAAATRAASKLGERRKDRRVEQAKVAHQSVAGNAPIVNAVSC